MACVARTIRTCRSLASRGGLTLIELLMSIMITAMLSMVLMGMVMAVNKGWEHASSAEAISSQSRAVIERIRLMVGQSAAYQISGNTPQVGLAVVERLVNSTRCPEMLVVWCGGRLGGMFNGDIQTRLPKVNELLIYAPDPSDLTRFVEICVSGNSNSIDFRAADFATTIRSLVNSSAATERILLCDRVRVSNLASASNTLAGNVRFELEESPTATALAGVTAGTTAWNNLTWSQGVVGADYGLRQASIRIEIQLEQVTKDRRSTTETSAAMPCVGSASFRYVYRS